MKNRSLRVRVLTAFGLAVIVTVTAGTAAADTISLAWDPSPEPTVAGYMLHVGTQSGSYTQHVDVGMSTVYGWSGAVAGQRYCFAVSAYNGSYLEGSKSAEVCGYSSTYPSLVNPGSRSSVVGQATSLQLQGVDPNGLPVSYVAVGLPPGLNLMASTGYISGTPTTAGNYTVTATVSNGVLTSSQTFAWSVTSGGTTGGTGTGGGLRGDYYSGASFDTLVTTRTDASVNFSWSGSPAPNVPADNFSVQWTGQIVAPVTGTYTFSTVSDDGVRMWIGNQLLIDNWTDHAATTNTSGGISLQAGQRYSVTVQYYDRLYGAVIQLMWSYPGQGTQVIPASAFAGSTTAPPPPSSAGLRGDYYSDTNFGTLVTTRGDSTVDFSWSGSPAADVPADNFSVRWTGEITAPTTGIYTFSTTSDDGVRLWIGNQLVIDNWTDHAATTNTSGGVSLQGGQRYAVRLEFYDSGDGAVIRLMWSYPGQGTQVIPASAFSGSTTAPPPSAGLRGDYYSGVGFGTLVTTRTDSTVDFSWSGSPAPNVPADNFSVRWTGEIVAPVTGVYTFSTTSDDGVRLWVGNQLVIDNWTDHAAMTNTSGGVSLQGGQRYAMRLEFYDSGGGAVMRLMWSYPGQSTQVIPASAFSGSTTAPPPTSVGLRGDYYSDPSFGTLVTTRTDSTVDFTWSGSPAGGVPADDFSVRWTGEVTAPVTGIYTFSTMSDDGVRLWIGNQLVIDNWTDHAPTTNTSGGVSLQGGQQYAVRLEFYEAAGGAMVQLQWTYPGQSTQVIPASALSSSP